MALCNPPFQIKSFDRSLSGLRTVASLGDGQTVALDWHKSFINPPGTWDLVYNIYYSTDKKDVFTDGVKFVITDGSTSTNIQASWKLGDIYYFAVRPSAHEVGTLDVGALPYINGLAMYPEAGLREDMSATDMIIPLDDASLFPPTGLVLIGAEIIGYSSVDLVTNNLIVSQRGVYGYDARIHTTDGYDGYHFFDNPFVTLWRGFEDQNNAVGLDEIKFEKHYPRTDADGYRGQVDIVTGSKNLSVVDDENAGFPAYDQSGYDRTHMADYLSGKCIGTYFGGEYGCADGYDDADGPTRGLGVQDHMNMREEYLLELTGEPVMLFRRQWEGKNSFHYDSSRENTAYRGLDTYGTNFVSGYEQFYSPRRSDGKILVRFGPTKEDYKREEPGIENVFIPNCWTLVTPSIRDGDFIIRFNQDGSEEWRYEIIDVERNRTILEESGAQKFTGVRVRKTDPIYQVRAFRDTAMFPQELLTGVGSVPGPGGIPPHMHRIVINENTLSLAQINQETSIIQGHTHPIINGVVQEALGHTHDIVLP